MSLAAKDFGSARQPAKRVAAQELAGRAPQRGYLQTTPDPFCPLARSKILRPTAFRVHPVVV
jgi:hypothetical protein